MLHEQKVSSMRGSVTQKHDWKWATPEELDEALQKSARVQPIRDMVAEYLNRTAPPGSAVGLIEWACWYLWADPLLPDNEVGHPALDVIEEAFRVFDRDSLRAYFMQLVSSPDYYLPLNRKWLPERLANLDVDYEIRRSDLLDALAHALDPDYPPFDIEWRVDFIDRAFSHPDPTVREAANNLVDNWESDWPRYLEILEKHLKDEPSEMLRKGIQNSIEWIQSKA